jgi:hypothetical protein
MARGGARTGAGRPKKTAAPNPATPNAPRLPAAPRGGTRPGSGRPVSKKFAPSADQRGNVEAMTGFGISQDEIRRVVINPETGKPIDKKTLELYFADEIETGHIKANATVGRVAYATITAAPGGIPDNHARAELTKFWLARRMGWKETNVHQHKGEVEVSNARGIVTSLIARLSSARTAGSGNSSDDGSTT